MNDSKLTPEQTKNKDSHREQLAEAAEAGTQPLSRERRQIFHGKAILMGPGSGKSTIEKKYEGTVLDVETRIDFYACLHDSMYGPMSLKERFSEEGAEIRNYLKTDRSCYYRDPKSPSNAIYTSNFEALCDINSLWFRVALPTIWAGLLLGRLVTFNLVAPDSAYCITLSIDGLNQVESGTVSHYRISQQTLEEHMVKRRELQQGRKIARPDEGPIRYQHHNFGWTTMAHYIHDGICNRCNTLEQITEDSLMEKAEEMKKLLHTKIEISKEVSKMFRCIEFKRKGETENTILIEIFPRTWVLHSSRHPIQGIYLHLERNDMKLYLDPWAAGSTAENSYCQIHIHDDEVLCHRMDGREIRYELVSGSHAYESSYIVQPRQLHKAQGTVEKTCVLLYYGSFAPFHKGHVETLELAQKHVCSEGWNVLGAYVTPSGSLSKEKKHHIYGLGGWTARATIAQWCIAHLRYAVVDFGQGDPDKCVESIAKRFDSITVFWINGSDIRVTQRLKRQVQEAPKNVQLLFVPRKGFPTSPEALQQMRNDLPDTPIHVGTYEAELQLSSTAARQMIHERKFQKAREIVGNSAALAYAIWAFQEVDGKNAHNNWISTEEERTDGEVEIDALHSNLEPSLESARWDSL